MMKTIEQFPRIAASGGFAPIEHLRRLSEHLGGPQIFMKRDDLGSLALGGNKLRKLEFLFGEALHTGCRTIVTVGALQSNHARLTAALAARLGLECHLVLKDEVAGRSDAYHRSANRFLDGLLGAQVEEVARHASLPDALAARTEALAKAGRRPYAIPVGGSNAVGSLGYVGCAHEIAQHEAAENQAFTHIVVVSGSGGTHAGLLAGKIHAGLRAKLLGIAISRGAAEQAPIVAALARQTADLLEMGPEGLDEALHLDDGFYLPGYGLPNDAALEAISLCARLEGVLLDPVYTGKAMAAVVSHIRGGRFDRDDRILFIHTGGAPALFAYVDEFETTVRAHGNGGCRA